MNKTYLMNLRLNEWERIKIKENSFKFTKGNVSMWLRYASMHLEPSLVQRKKLKKMLKK